MRLQNFIYLQQQNAIFGYVPKVACTNWKCIFRYLAGYEDYLNARLSHDRALGGLTYLDTLETAESLLSDHAVDKIAMVRNPYSRLLSAYRNKIEPFVESKGDFHGGYWSAIADDLADHFSISVCDITFDKFTRWLEESSSDKAQDEHWLPQYQILAPDEIDYQFVGKFESLKDDSKKIMDRLGVDISFPTQSDVGFKATGSSDLLSFYYSSSAVSDRVFRIYENDFDAYGYSRIV